MVKMIPLATYEALLEKYHALVAELASMKRDGFMRPDQYGEPAPVKLLPDLVQKAIAEIARGEVSLTRTLTDAAWDLIRGGVAEADIVQRITDGEPVDV